MFPIGPKTLYWEKADWWKAYTSVRKLYTADDNLFDYHYPTKFEIDHRFYEDLRKRLWLLQYQSAGHYDYFTRKENDPEDKNYLYEPYDLDSEEDETEIYKQIGAWKVSTYDTRYGWLLWFNFNELTKGEAAENCPPPANIHPSDNEWITKNDLWQLEANPNKYYQFDYNAPHKLIQYSVDNGDQTVPADPTISLYMDKASGVFPQQTDPMEQRPYINFTNRNNTKKPDYKHKLAYDEMFVTDKGNLGPVFGCLSRWIYSDQQSNAIRVDDFRIRHNVIFDGNQYANAGGWKNNQPNQKSHGTNDTNWKYNPKNSLALQNQIEWTLSDINFRLPVTDLWEENFRLTYDLYDSSVTYDENDIVRSGSVLYISLQDTNNESLSDTDWWSEYHLEENTKYDSLPSVESEFWGENEAGFELFLRLLEERTVEDGRIDYSNDWYFDSNSPYVPKKICETHIDWVGSGSYTTQEAYDLLDHGTNIGTWRRTWGTRTFGRPSPYMCSSKPSNDLYHMPWNPDSIYTKEEWFGSRVTSVPTIDLFITGQAPILQTVSDYGVVLSGDYTKEIKQGHMIHLYNEPNQSIASGIINTYVLAIEYDDSTNCTCITIQHNHNDKQLLGYNTEIAERHDAQEIVYKWIPKTDTDTDTDTDTVENGYWSVNHIYEPTIDMLWEMHALLQFAIYYYNSTPTDEIHLQYLRQLPHAYSEGVQALHDLLEPELRAGIPADPDEWAALDGESGDGYSYSSDNYIRCDSFIDYKAELGSPTMHLTYGAARISEISLRTMGYNCTYVWFRMRWANIHGGTSVPSGASPKYFGQRTGEGELAIESVLVPDDEREYFSYKYIPFNPVDNDWYMIVPQITDNWSSAGSAAIGYSRFVRNVDDPFEFADNSMILQLDFSKVPNSVWERDYIEHIDVNVNLPYILDS